MMDEKEAEMKAAALSRLGSEFNASELEALLAVKPTRLMNAVHEVRVRAQDAEQARRMSACTVGQMEDYVDRLRAEVAKVDERVKPPAERRFAF